MARYSICAGSPRVVAGQMQLWTPGITEVLPLLQQMEQATQQIAPANPVIPPVDLPFVGGWLGWLGYDVAWAIERLPWLKDDKLPFPVAFWYEPAEFAVLDHHLQQLWLAAETPAGLDIMSQCLLRCTATGSDQTRPGRNNTSIYIDKRIEQHLDQHLEQHPCKDALRAASISVEKDLATTGFRFETERADFEQAVRRAQAHIRAGDVFQVNHSLRFQAQTTANSWQVYQTLHRINPSPFASYWHTPWGAVVSCSPERLVSLGRGDIAQSRPIAGTRPRGATAQADRLKAQHLRAIAKNKPNTSCW